MYLQSEPFRRLTEMNFLVCRDVLVFHSSQMPKYSARSFAVARLGSARFRGSMRVAEAGGRIRFHSDPSSSPRDVRLRREHEYLTGQIAWFRSFISITLSQAVSNKYTETVISIIPCLYYAFSGSDWGKYLLRTFSVHVLSDI